MIEGITVAAEVTRQWHHLIATPLSAVMTKRRIALAEASS